MNYTVAPRACNEPGGKEWQDGIRDRPISYTDRQSLWQCLKRLYPRLILGLHPANERLRYKVVPSLIGWRNPRISPVYPVMFWTAANH